MMAELVSMQMHNSHQLNGSLGQGTVSVLLPPNPIENDIKNSSLNLRRPPVSLQWRDISLTTGKGKPILQGVSGSANTGELTAIMGPSGAGKSTLLNILSGFTRAKVKGDITVNGAPRDMRVFRKLSCYIMQDDHLLPHLTVRETVQFAARLKIPTSVSRKDRELAVDECLEILGLTERQKNKASKLSGGQRKRLCIAQELVSNPPLLFLDEPTSGLDSSSCLQCVQLLKMLAKGGRTVICTIHQPSARIFELFDKLYMLAEGHRIYTGPTNNLIPFLSEVGLSCPTYHNPADFATEVAAGEHGDWVWKLKTAIDKADAAINIYSLADESFIINGNSEVGLQASTLCILEDQKKAKPSHLKDDSLESSFGSFATSSWHQFKVLTHRSFICTLREPMTSQIRFIAHIVTGILLGLLYYQIGNDASKVYSNSGFHFFSLLFLYFTAMMPTVLTFPLEKPIFAREYINSYYSTKMYYLGKTISDIPFQIFYPLIYCIIVYWMTAQPNDPVRFGLFVLSSIMMAQVAQSFGLLMGACFSVQNAVFLGPVLSIPTLLFSGFFISLDTMPSYLKWLSYISYYRFSLQSVYTGIYGMDRPELDCDKISCPFQEPKNFLHVMDMEDGILCVDYSALLAFFTVFRLICYYVLYFKMVCNR